MENSFFETLRNISFKDYAPIPFWSWNNKIEAEEARLQIRQMKEVGYGGVIIHARAGLTTEYLSEDWFACVAACVEEAKKLDMCVWIYDEFGYPSGFVGGSLLENESNRAEYLEYKRLERSTRNIYRGKSSRSSFRLRFLLKLCLRKTVRSPSVTARCFSGIAKARRENFCFC